VWAGAAPRADENLGSTSIQALLNVCAFVAAPACHER